MKQQNKNSLTTDPIPSLIKKIAIPASVGFFFNTMYNVVDTYYAGLLSTDALAALSISFPVFFLIIALSSGVSTGTTSILANSLGSGDSTRSSHNAQQAISFALLLSIALTAIGLTIAPFLFASLGADGDYLLRALAYIRPIFWGSLFFVLTFIFNAILSSTGDTKSFRNFLITGFLLNLILDPLLMFGWGAVPAFGIAGVAYATVIIQCIGALYLGYKVKQTGMLSGISVKTLMPEKSAYKEIVEQGLPAGLSMMSVAVGIFIITYFISIFGKSSVAAYGIATRIEQIVLLPMIGLNIAAITLIGQNNGAKKYDRIKEIVNKTFKYALYISVIGTFLVFFFSRYLMQAFTQDQQVITIGSQYLKIAAILIYAYGVLFIVDAALRGLKKPLYPLVMGLARQIAVPIILFYVSVHVLKTNIFGIWWSVFITVILASIVSFLYLRKVLSTLSN